MRPSTVRRLRERPHHEGRRGRGQDHDQAGPLKKFDMNENMIMTFRARDPAMLKTVKPGDRVRFVPERLNGQFTVMKIENVR